MAAKHPDHVYCCDICGKEEFSEEEIRSHTLVAHIEGAISCPFCDLGDISADEMIYHVNSTHLEFLSPTEDNVQFIESSSGSSDDAYICSNGLPDNNFTSAPEGSPQRANLSLNLNPNKIKKIVSPRASSDLCVCPLCDYSNKSPTKLQEHVNRQHFDLTSPSFPEFLNNDGGCSPYLCPLCDRNFESSRDVELHVNVDHNDVLSPVKSTQATPGDENSNDCCPVCGCSNFMCSLDLASHIEEHFSPKSPNGVVCSPRTPFAITPLVSDVTLLQGSQMNPVLEKLWLKSGKREEGNADHLLALEMERREREEQRLREQREFRILQAQYGMDNQGNFREQSITNMQRAVYAGELSVADFYNRQVELFVAERDGVDDGHSCTKGLIPKIRAFSMATPNVEHTWLCSAVDHYGSTYGDKGWGCGYRNIQMMLSSLVHNTKYSTRLFNGRFAIPSISKLQELIETAWRQGFDPAGCEQLGGRLINTRKWIGATEVVTFLSSFRIRGQLIDCHQPTGPNGTHPEMFAWVKEYFMKDEEFKPPVYLQHHGHSRSIIGLEELRDGSLQLLVFDPSHSKSQMEQFSTTELNSNAMRLIRRPLLALKARQYQLVFISGLLDSEEEYQKMKILCSQRIPPSN
ncbi:zinc finger-containing ubiquitin peptidase 1-like [Uloborus diversus]|uniref:zinc finger-containing ubiquitin peptidase 1-like n=1 Tax=Uloborus diversus TaxID=327109 RepID=UPI002409E64E|nr:zinc finger-containing ubiquitin peptidase 1-like [Uloborus diversus]